MTDGAIEATTGFRSDDLADPDRRIPLWRYIRAWQGLIEAVPDPALGVRMSEAYDLRDWVVVGFMVMHSRTVGESLEKICRYGRIINSSVEVTPKIENGLVCIRQSHKVPIIGTIPPLVEWSIATTFKALWSVSGRKLPFTALHLRHPAPPDPTPQERFFRCPIVWEQPDNCIIFPAEWLSKPVATASPQLLAYLEPIANRLLLQAPPPDDDEGVMRCAIESAIIAGDPSAAAVAKGLGISQRTLQRRLEEAGTTYSQLLQDVRIALAGRMLVEQQATTHEVAAMLGYAELSSFHRAFKRWTGLTPEQYRAQHMTLAIPKAN